MSKCWGTVRAAADHLPGIFSGITLSLLEVLPLKTTDNSQLLRNLENHSAFDTIQAFVQQKAYQGLTNETTIPHRVSCPAHPRLHAQRLIMAALPGMARAVWIDASVAGCVEPLFLSGFALDVFPGHHIVTRTSGKAMIASRTAWTGCRWLGLELVRPSMLFVNVFLPAGNLFQM
jgi:hypothetical protein